MSVWLVLILAGIGCLIGPLAMRLAGAAAFVLALTELAIVPNNSSTIAGVVLCVIGALLVWAGAVWRIHRQNGTCTVTGGWLRERVAREVLRGNPSGRFRRRLAFRIAWRLTLWRRDRLHREAAQAAETASEDATTENHSVATDDEVPVTLTEWFDAAYPGRPRRSSLAEPWEEPAPNGSVREQTNEALEEVRRHLEPIVRNLLVIEVGPDWADRLEDRRQRRLDWSAKIATAGQTLADCRVLFGTIAYDWTMIEDCFISDPSSAGKALLAILASYYKGGPDEGDPAVATKAFREILEAISPQACEAVKDGFEEARASEENCRQEYWRPSRTTMRA